MVTRVISATAKAGVEMSVQHSPPKAPPEGPEAVDQGLRGLVGNL